ncbi:MAG: SMC-Scp complex subunit ScpB, partial [Sphaerochaeta sp.]
MDKKRQTGNELSGQGPLLSTEARLVEVILFLENEPVSLEKLMKMTSFSEETAKAALAQIKEHYALFLHGL